jgi:DNA replication and repair protein RecF
LTRLNEITLTQFRNYSSAQFRFPERITCITGPNGSGKTNLLDAVYYLCYTKSYFSNQQQLSAQWGTDGFRIDGRFQESVKSCPISLKWQNGRKELSADGQEYERVADHIGRFCAVMIAPDDLALINEGNELRRRWLDSILSQTDRQYFEALMLYQQVLQQRNAWLKMQAQMVSETRTELEYYDARMSEASRYLFAQRSRFFKDFLPLLDRFYHELCGGNEAVQLEYQSELEHSPLSQLLINSFRDDLRLQRTTKGLHRDGLLFNIQGQPLRQFGSQGQKKSFLFALKLAQYTYIAESRKSLPILLLDDVFEKLDQRRMEALLKMIQADEFGQVILTDTHAERARAAFGGGVKIGEIEL